MPNLFAEGDSPVEIFYRYTRLHEHCDVLVDRSVADSLFAEVPRLRVQPQQELSNEVFNANPHQSPALIRLCRAEYPLLERIFEYAIEEVANCSQLRSACAFLLGANNLSALGSHLSRGLNGQFIGLGTAYFRYFDPRVWVHLPSILEDAQLYWLMKGVTDWLCVDWRGCINHTARPLSPLPEEVLMPISLPRYAEKQWKQLEMVGLINRVVYRLQKRGYLVENLGKVEQSLMQASMRVQDEDDQVTYAAHFMMHGEEFTHHPHLEELLKFSSESKVPLSAVFRQNLIFQ